MPLRIVSNRTEPDAVGEVSPHDLGCRRLTCPWDRAYAEAVAGGAAGAAETSVGAFDRAVPLNLTQVMLA